MADVIFVTNARGGAGATTCAVKLGYALASLGERTLVIDGDYDCASGLEICGLQGLSVYTLGDVEKGACRVKQAILQHPSSPNLYVLPTLDCKSAAVAERAVKECEGLFDRVLCDGVAQGACHKAVVVTEPYSHFLLSAKKKCASLKDGGFKDVGLLVNKVNGGLVYGGAILTPQELATLTRTPLWGVIPEDLSLPLGKIKAGTQRAFSLAAERIMGKSDKVFGVIKPYLGMKGILKRKARELI